MTVWAVGPVKYRSDRRGGKRVMTVAHVHDELPASVPKGMERFVVLGERPKVGDLVTVGKVVPRPKGGRLLRWSCCQVDYEAATAPICTECGGIAKTREKARKYQPYIPGPRVAELEVYAASVGMRPGPAITALVLAHLDRLTP